jgi:4a-hydroxytetrahydrobiopterin dehydratase
MPTVLPKFYSFYQNFQTQIMWQEQNNALQCTFRFRDFVQAFAFMTEVAFAAEKINHHPNWSNVWNTVTIHLNTHDAGNIITDKDHALATAIDGIFEKYKG